MRTAISKFSSSKFTPRSDRFSSSATQRGESLFAWADYFQVVEAFTLPSGRYLTLLAVETGSWNGEPRHQFGVVALPEQNRAAMLTPERFQEVSSASSARPVVCNYERTTDYLGRIPDLSRQIAYLREALPGALTTEIYFGYELVPPGTRLAIIRQRRHYDRMTVLTLQWRSAQPHPDPNYREVIARWREQHPGGCDFIVAWIIEMEHSIYAVLRYPVEETADSPDFPTVIVTLLEQPGWLTVLTAKALELVRGALTCLLCTREETHPHDIARFLNPTPVTITN